MKCKSVVLSSLLDVLACSTQVCQQMATLVENLSRHVLLLLNIHRACAQGAPQEMEGK